MPGDEATPECSTLSATYTLVGTACREQTSQFSSILTECHAFDPLLRGFNSLTNSGTVSVNLPIIFMLYILNLLSNYVLLTSFHNILDKKRRYLRERTLTYQHHPHLSFSSFFSLELVALYHRVSLQDTHSSDDQSPERIRCAIIIDIY